MSDRSFCARFGPEVARAGVDTFPRALFDLAEAEGLSRAERLALLGLFSAWRGGLGPRLSLRALAGRSGLCRSGAAAAVRRLEARGLIRVVRRRSPERGDLPSEYDLSPLLERLEALARERPGVRPPKADGFAARFGPVLAADGTLTLPARLRRAPWVDGLSAGERLTVAALLSAKWDGEDPALSLSALAARAGITRRWAAQVVGRLEARGLLRRLPGNPNRYDLSPLLALLAETVNSVDTPLSTKFTGVVNSMDTPVSTEFTRVVNSVDTPLSTKFTGVVNSVDTLEEDKIYIPQKQKKKKVEEDKGRPAAFSKGQAPPPEDIRVLFGVLGVKTLPAGEFKAYRQLMERFGVEQVAAAAGELVGRGVRPAPAAVAAVLAGGAAGGAGGVEDLQAVWARMQAALKSRLSANNYRAYVEPLRPVGLAGGRLTLSGSGFVIDWVRTRFLTLFKRAAQEAGLDGVQFAADRPGPAPSGRPAAV
jgi:DNA-binding MarR family transcriptional regulator